MAVKTKLSNTATVTEDNGKYILRLPKLPGPNAPTEEFYSVNGRNFLIKRGEAVEVPRELYELICDNIGSEEAAQLFTEIEQSKSAN